MFMMYLLTTSRALSRALSRSLCTGVALASLWVSAAHAAAAMPADSAAQASDAIQAAAELDLRVTYEATQISSDGVQRDSRYTNRIYRRKGQLWVERELPEVLRHHQAHGDGHGPEPHAGHAHEAVRGAPLSIRRADDGTVDVTLVLEALHRVISVDAAHHGNVGFGGSFDNLYWIVPPTALQQMQKVGAVSQGVQRYRSRTDAQRTEVDWDVAGQFARRVEYSEHGGIERVRITASRLPAPLAQPWARLADYERGDYSDLLD